MQNNTLNQAPSNRKIAAPQRNRSKKNKPAKKVDSSDLVLAVPRHEQDHMASLVNRVTDSMVQKYVMSLVSPKSMTCRIPDSFNRLTSVVQSITVLDIPIFMDATVNSGRFSLLVQPHLGSLGNVRQFAVALSDGTEAWPTDWSTGSAYAGLINGKDVRLDPNFRTLTQSPLLSAVYTSVDAAKTRALPFGDAVAIASGYGLNVKYTASSGNFQPGTGLYFVSISIPLTGLSPTGGVVVVSDTGAIISEQFSSDGGPDLSATWSGYINFPTDAADINISTEAGTIVQVASPSAISFVSTFDDDSTLIPTSNRGLITQYRPVSLSVLATYLGPEIVNGGMISSAYCPGSTSDTNYFAQVNPSIVGSLQNWENLAQIPGSYNGPLRDGTYAYWTPESYEDVEFNNPDDVVRENFPTLIVSGQYIPGTAISGSVSGVVRVEIVRNIELETTSTLFEKAKCVGSQAYMDLANQILSDEFHAMPNATHLAFLDKIWKGVKSGAKFVWDHRKPILAAAEAVAPLLL